MKKAIHRQTSNVKKTFFLAFVIFLLTAMSAVFINPAVAAGTIYVRADGSIDPPTASIQRDGNVYTFTGNINDSIVVQTNNIVIDGAGYTLQGPGGSTTVRGIVLNGMNNVTIKNLKVTAFYCGIFLSDSSNNIVYGNNVTDNNHYGIWLNYSSNNRIYENYAYGNGWGFLFGGPDIYFGYSLNNTVSGNNMTDSEYGIFFSHSSGNTISENSITNNLFSPDPCIYLGSSNGNRFSGNDIKGGFWGIELVGSDFNSYIGNNVTGSLWDGIVLVGSNSNSLSGNNVTKNGDRGITLRNSSSNIISGNSIENQGDGIKLYDSLSNTISGNNIKNNGYYGVWLNYSSSNVIYHNNFDHNTEQVHSLNSTNVWDGGYPSGGNYWSDYNGTDGNGDGIGDTPYIIDASNQDGYPLVSTFQEYSLTVNGTSLPPTVAQLFTVAWVPPPANAAAATIVTAVAVAVVSIVAAAVSNPVGTSAGKAAEKTRELIPESVKKWLSDFASSKRKPTLDQKTGSPFLPTKAEALAYGVSLAVLTLSFSYVKVNDFTLILAVLPTILATAVIVELLKTFSLVVFARKLGVWTEHRLWYFGLAMFLVTTFAFGIPFSSPSRSLYHAPEYTKRREGIVSAAAILVTLAFGGVFFVLLVSGFTLIGSTGLAMCAIMAFLDTFPVAPMNGKAIYQDSKAAWAVLFTATLTVYASWLILL